jgi:energy-converting hydrogenase B subunit C
MIIAQPIIFIICGLLVLVASFGLLRFEKMPHILYARLHIIGVIDFGCSLALVALGQLNVALVAVLYFILTPVAIHSIAKSQYEGGAGDDY